TPVFVPTLPHVAAHPAAAALAGVVAVLSSALPYTLEMLAMKHLNARQYGILASLDPVMAALIGLALLGERLAPSQWIGILCIVAASIGGVMVPRAARPTAATAGEP
ncbi:EamA family transporter, partial [Nguyenibacter vanlangensis]